jgi:HlyD family secretion protein
VKKLIIVLVIVALGLGGVAYWLSRPGESRKIAYTTTPVEYGNLTESINATGVLQPHEIAVVTGDVPSKVKDILVKINQDVKKDQPLLRLDDREASVRMTVAKLTQQIAETDLQKATAEQQARREAVNIFARMDKQVRRQGDYTKAKAELEAATAQVQEAKLTIEKAKEGVNAAQLGLDVMTVKAPIAGTIIDKKVYLGQPVGVSAPQEKSSASKNGSTSGGPLFVIARNMQNMDVHAQVLEGDIAKIKLGQEATFRPYAYSNRPEPFHAKVSEIHQMPINIQGAVLYDVVLKTKNVRDRDTKEWMLRPGMTASVEIVRREHKDRWKVPTAALDFQLDEHYETPEARAKLDEWKGKSDRDNWQVVWTVKDGQAWPIFVRTNDVDAEGESEGISAGQFKEVLEWDPEVKGRLNPTDRQSYLQVITFAPVWQKPGFLDQPTKFKFS